MMLMQTLVSPVWPFIAARKGCDNQLHLSQAEVTCLLLPARQLQTTLTNNCTGEQQRRRPLVSRGCAGILSLSGLMRKHKPQIHRVQRHKHKPQNHRAQAWKCMVEVQWIWCGCHKVKAWTGAHFLQGLQLGELDGEDASVLIESGAEVDRTSLRLAETHGLYGVPPMLSGLVVEQVESLPKPHLSCKHLAWPSRPHEGRLVWPLQ